MNRAGNPLYECQLTENTGGGGEGEGDTAQDHETAVILSEIWRILAPNEAKDLWLLLVLCTRNQ